MQKPSIAKYLEIRTQNLQFKIVQKMHKLEKPKTERIQNIQKQTELFIRIYLKNKTFTNTGLAELLEIKRQTAGARLKKLIKNGFVEILDTKTFSRKIQYKMKILKS